MRLLKTKSLPSTVVAASLCPLMDLVAIATETQLSIFRNRTQACIATLHISKVTTLAWSPNARLLAAGTELGEIHIVHVEGPEVVRVFSPTADVKGAGPTVVAQTGAMHGCSVVALTWMNIHLPRALPLSNKDTLPRPVPAPPQAADRASTASATLTLLNTAITSWQLNHAALLIALDAEGRLCAFLDGVTEVWRYTLPLANRFSVLRLTCSGSNLGVVLRNSAKRPEDCGSVQIGLIDLAPMIARVTRLSTLRSILTVELTQWALAVVRDADLSWKTAVQRLGGQAVGGSQHWGDERAALVGYLFRPSVVPFNLEDKANLPPDSRGSSTSRGRAPLPRDPSPHNLGRGRGAPLEAGPVLEPAALVPLNEQLQASYTEAVSAALNQAHRALSTAAIYAATLVDVRVLEDIVIGSQRASGTRDSSNSNPTDSDFIDSDANAGELVVAMDRLIDRWLYAVSADREALASLIVWSGRSRLSALDNATLSASDTLKIYRLLTTLIDQQNPHSAVQGSDILSDVFADSTTGMCDIAQPEPSAGALSRWTRLFEQLKTTITTCQATVVTHTSDATGESRIRLEEGLSVADTMGAQVLCYSLETAGTDTAAASLVLLGVTAELAITRVELAPAGEFWRPKATSSVGDPDLDAQAGIQLPVACRAGSDECVHVVTRRREGPDSRDVTLWKLSPSGEPSLQRLPIHGIIASPTAPLLVDVAPNRGFAVIISGQRYAIIDLDDDDGCDGVGENDAEG